MKKNTIAMKVVSILAAIALVVTTCFISEISWADEHSGQESIDESTEAQESEFTDVNQHREFNRDGCEAFVYKDNSDFIIVHAHNELCYEGGNLICEITADNFSNVFIGTVEEYEEYVASQAVEPQELEAQDFENQNLENQDLENQEINNDAEFVPVEGTPSDVLQDDDADTPGENENTGDDSTPAEETPETPAEEIQAEETLDVSRNILTGGFLFGNVVDIIINEGRVPMAPSVDEANITDDDASQPTPTVIEHAHGDSCFTVVEESVEVVDPEDIILPEIQSLIDTNIGSVASGAYKGSVFYDYYKKLVSKSESEDDLKAYVSNIISIIDSYSNSLYAVIRNDERIKNIDSAVQPDEYNNQYKLICNEYMAKIIEVIQAGTDDSYTNFAQTIGISGDLNLLLFKLSMLCAIDNFNSLSSIETSNVVSYSYSPFSYNGMIAFSLDCTLNQGSDYSQSDSQSALGEKNSLARYILYCANCYVSPSWIRTAGQSTSNKEETLTILRTAVQIAIWSFTNEFEIKGDSNIEVLANEIRKSAESSNGSSDKFNWYVSSGSNANLLVSTNVKDGEEYYIGVRANNAISGEMSLFIMSQIDFETDTSVDERMSDSIPAYCMNKSYQQYPENTFDGKFNNNDVDDRTIYTKVSISDTKDLKSYNSFLNDSKAESAAVVLLNGYPSDYSGIKAEYNLTEDQFKLVTQLAIWYFTDEYTKQREIDYEWYYHKSTIQNLSTNEANAYNKLINIADNITGEMSAALSSALNSGKISVYSSGSTNLQNLLVYEYGEDPEPEPDPEPDLNYITLRITKTVIEKNKDKNKEYKFIITIKNKDGNPYNSRDKSIGDLNFENGKAEFTLKDGESIVLDSTILEGYEATITEIDADNYYTRILTTVATETKEYSNTKTVSLKNITQNVDITFENTAISTDVPVPTGIRVDVLPYLIIMLTSIALLLGFVVRRRRV